MVVRATQALEAPQEQVVLEEQVAPVAPVARLESAEAAASSGFRATDVRFVLPNRTSLYVFRPYDDCACIRPRRSRQTRRAVHRRRAIAATSHGRRSARAASTRANRGDKEHPNRER